MENWLFMKTPSWNLQCSKDFTSLHSPTHAHTLVAVTIFLWKSSLKDAPTRWWNHVWEVLRRALCFHFGQEEVYTFTTLGALLVVKVTLHVTKCCHIPIDTALSPCSLSSLSTHQVTSVKCAMHHLGHYCGCWRWACGGSLDFFNFINCITELTV